MKLIIKLSDFNKDSCDEYYDYIKEHYPDDQEFDVIELINKISICKHNGIRWLIVNCGFAQTNEMLEYYKSLNPNYEDVRMLIEDCKFAQTHEMLEYYKSLDPDYYDVSRLIADCGFAETIEMLKYYKSLNPNYGNFCFLTRYCDFARDNWDSIKDDNMKLIIKLSDLDKKPCDRYLDYIQKHYQDNQEFDAIELINKISMSKHKDVPWLIKNCKFARTNGMLEYYKSLEPDFSDVSFLICKCEFAQTDEMLEYYKSLNPGYNDVSALIAGCELFQTNEMLEYYKSLNPNYKDVQWLIENCEFAQTDEMLEYYKSL